MNTHDNMLAYWILVRAREHQVEADNLGAVRMLYKQARRFYVELPEDVRGGLQGILVWECLEGDLGLSLD
jgi:hypothetical protein